MEKPRKPQELRPATIGEIDAAIAHIVAVDLGDMTIDASAEDISLEDSFMSKVSLELLSGEAISPEVSVRPNLRLVVDSDTLAVGALRTAQRETEQEPDRRRNEAERSVIRELLKALGEDNEVSADVELDYAVLEHLATLAGQEHCMLDVCDKATALTALDPNSDAEDSLGPALSHIQAMTRCLWIVAGNRRSIPGLKAMNEKYIKETTRLCDLTKTALIVNLWGIDQVTDMATWREKKGCPTP